MVHPRESKGVMARGTETTRKGAPRFCSGKADANGLCPRHAKVSAKMEAELARRREAQLHGDPDDHIMHLANKAPLNEAAVAEARRRGLIEEDHPIIKASEARGDSKPVSHEEFQRLARVGQFQLDGLSARSSAITGLDDNWDKVKSDSYLEATQSWGGATIDAHTGKALPQGSNKYALTVKDKGVDTVSVPEGATKAEFDAAMNLAKERFRPTLEREDHYLGVFHDDENGRIDIDPVLVVSSLEDVHTIGAATRAIGGAYNFKDSLGYWPPHVKEEGE